MTALRRHLVSDLYLSERAADARKHTNTHTEDAHCAPVSATHSAEQKSIHRGRCLRAAVYEKDL